MSLRTEMSYGREYAVWAPVSQETKVIKKT
nr:MAG TPA: hypothetical protein [Caudoviricetes sp.]